MDATERMRTALDNIEKVALGHEGAAFDLILRYVELAKGGVHTTSDAVRKIKEITGCGFDTALQAYKEGESVEAAIRLVDVWKTRASLK